MPEYLEENRQKEGKVVLLWDVGMPGKTYQS